MAGKANKNGVWVEELFLKLVIGLSHMIWQAYLLNSSFWPILNLHAIFVRLSPALDIIIKVNYSINFILTVPRNQISILRALERYKNKTELASSVLKFTVVRYVGQPVGGAR